MFSLTSTRVSQTVSEREKTQADKETEGERERGRNINYLHTELI